MIIGFDFSKFSAFDLSEDSWAPVIYRDPDVTEIVFHVLLILESIAYVLILQRDFEDAHHRDTSRYIARASS